jgi:hypothetical protein
MRTGCTILPLPRLVSKGTRSVLLHITGARISLCRICATLQQWTQKYPHDFAVAGTEGALDALIKSAARRTHLLHYATEFHEFQQSLPRLLDTDSSWAKKPDEHLPDDSDDSYSLSDDDDVPEQPSSSSSYDFLNDDATTYSHPETLSSTGRSSGEYRRPASRMRKSSLPFTGMDFGLIPPIDARKQKLKLLSSVAHDLDMMLTSEIAEEITRICTKLLLSITPRDWLKYAFVGGQKSAESCPVTRFNQFANRLGDWVVSLILCHDKARSRARQIEKFIDVALALRKLCNYGALRAVVAGINSATYPEDPAMESFRKHSPDGSKLLRSWDVLFQSSGGHKAYRLALKNTAAPCVPALEIHMSDLLRTQEGNRDVHEQYPQLIHWAKFNLMAKFVDTVVECQDKCRRERAYAFPTRQRILELLLCDELMDQEVRCSHLRLWNWY